MTTPSEAAAHSATTYHITLIADARLVWLTHEKPVADHNGILEFTDSCGNEITVPQSAVWIEGKRLPKK